MHLKGKYKKQYIQLHTTQLTLNNYYKYDEGI